MLQTEICTWTWKTMGNVAEVILMLGFRLARYTWVGSKIFLSVKNGSALYNQEVDCQLPAACLWWHLIAWTTGSCQCVSLLVSMHCWCGHPSSSSDSSYPSSVPQLMLSLGFEGQAAQDRTSVPKQSASKALRAQGHTPVYPSWTTSTPHIVLKKRNVTVNTSPAI